MILLIVADRNIFSKFKTSYKIMCLFKKFKCCRKKSSVLSKTTKPGFEKENTKKIYSNLTVS